MITKSGNKNNIRVSTATGGHDHVISDAVWDGQATTARPAKQRELGNNGENLLWTSKRLSNYKEWLRQSLYKGSVKRYNIKFIVESFHDSALNTFNNFTKLKNDRLLMLLDNYDDNLHVSFYVMKRQRLEKICC